MSSRVSSAVSLGDSSEILAARWGILSRFLAPQPMLAAPLLPGPGSSDGEGWRSLRGRRLQTCEAVGVFRHTGDVWWGEGRGGSPEGGKHKLNTEEKYIKDWMVLGVRWEGVWDQVEKG